MPENDQFWKARIPLMTAAWFAFALAAAQLWYGLGSSSRRWILGFVALILVGFGLLFSASSVQDWCAYPQARWGDGVVVENAAGRGLTFGSHAWHEPTLRDCLTVHRHPPLS